MGFNKGEWSELYTFLYLLENPRLSIVNEKLEIIESNLFKILEIVTNEKKYKINQNKILKIVNDEVVNEYGIKYISEQNNILLKAILSHTKAKGSFNIDELQLLIDDLLDGKKPKGSSLVKGDLEANVLDKNYEGIVNIKYNIKSNLGSSATLLNASNNTNFIYEVKNIDDDIMHECNNLDGRKKLLDRCTFLNKNETTIEFVKVESEVFDYNLKLIDSNLNQILAKILYLSYERNEKDIQELMSIISNNEDDYSFYKKKIGDFSNAVTFGMRAGEKWDGTNEVNGGILLVEASGNIYLLDIIYFKEIVNNYIINNIKLDSPSSTRYKMFDVYKENNRYYFKLNLQIRFK